jgi:hypothetical protein
VRTNRLGRRRRPCCPGMLLGEPAAQPYHQNMLQLHMRVRTAQTTSSGGNRCCYCWSYCGGLSQQQPK